MSLLYHRARVRLRGVRFRARPADAISAEELDRIDTLWETGSGLQMIDMVPGHDFHTRSLRLALDAGEPYRVVRSLAMLAESISTEGLPTRRRTLRLLERAEAIGRGIDHPHARGMLELARGIADFMVVRLRPCLESIRRAEATFTAECPGVSWELNTGRFFGLMALVDLGEYPEARQRWAEGLQRTQERGDLYGESVLETLIGTHIRLADGDPDGAERALRSIMARWSSDGFHLQHVWQLCGEAFIALYRGDGRGALERLRARWPALQGSLFLRAQVVRNYLVYLRAIAAVTAARSAHNPRSLLASARRDVRWLRRESGPWARALADLAAAGCHAVAGAEAAAARAYAAAAEGHAAVDMTVFAASARRRLGELVGGDRGHGLIAEADAELTRRGVRDPERIAAMHAG
jgi:hypothetical protein